MSRKRAFKRMALAAVAAVTTLAVLLFALDRGRDGESIPTPDDEPAIDARAILSPPDVLFGDTVRAIVEVTLDRNRVDPDSVRVQADFTPWQPGADVERLRRDGKTTTYLRMTYVLRCVVASCISTDPTAVQDFAQARVTYTAREGTASSGRGSVQVPWPQLLVGSRYSSGTAQGSGASAPQLRADLLSLPAVTYGVGPSFLFALLLAGSSVLAIAGAALVYLVLPRRASPPGPNADKPPEPVLTPLERALVLLQDPARADGAADQRRALELVAAGLVERGDMKLAQAARALAWSEPVPGVEETGGLAARARSLFQEELA